MVRASEKCPSTTFIVIDINHQMPPLRMLCLVTFIYIFKVTQFLELYILMATSSPERLSNLLIKLRKYNIEKRQPLKVRSLLLF